MVEDLFAAAAAERVAHTGPLADRLRPRTLDEVVGQDHLLGPGRPLSALVAGDRLGSVLLWGPPGTGKTTLARLIAEASSATWVALSAVTASVKDIREATESARRRLGENGRRTILFLDEIHRFTRSQQDALLPSVETGLLILIGATTENPLFEVNAPLRSRSTLFRLEPLDAEALATLARRGLELEEAEIVDEALELLCDRSGGDGRRLLTSLEVAVALAGVAAEHATIAAEDGADPAGGGADPAGGGADAAGGGADPGGGGADVEEEVAAPTGASQASTDGPPLVEVSHVESALGATSIRYGRDDHYDVVSAFIKSIRGSDVDASLHWLARMLEAGEDARFIARRLVILASEDVGMADPMSLLVAEAGFRAVEFVGLPEAQLNLAQVVIHLATAPKSNTVTTAIGRARADVRDRPIGEVPTHLRDGHHPGAKQLGHGVGYRYPHDDPAGWVTQQYLPDELAGRRYYRAGPHGREPHLVDRSPAVPDGERDEG